jgi:hypothetical protein
MINLLPHLLRDRYNGIHTWDLGDTIDQEDLHRGVILGLLEIFHSGISTIRNKFFSDRHLL